MTQRNHPYHGLTRVANATDPNRRSGDAEGVSELIAYRVQPDTQMRLVPASVERGWLDATTDRFGYRCLPLLIAMDADRFDYIARVLTVGPSRR